jgi:pimeloyl-ACP methyl ester carboxylesterase
MLARFLGRLAAFARLITFDKRGTGLSDRVPNEELPTLEERMGDVAAVLDAAESTEAALLGHSEGGNLAVLFAATHPERTSALVTAGIFAARRKSEEYPWAPTDEERKREIAQIEANWGSRDDVEHLAPSAAGDEVFAGLLATYFRRSASPGAAAALLRMNTQIDVRDVLPAIRVPTLVIHRTGDRDASVEEGRWIASRIPGAEFLELPGDDHLPWVGNQDAVLDAVQEFVTGARATPDPDRVLATLLFTDIVESTQRAAALGDRAWKELLERHRVAVRREIARFGGTEIDTAGDGFLVSFDGPGRAIRAALAIVDGVSDVGVELRCGVHTGEVEIVGTGVAGIAVHLAARVAAEAGASEILVSGTVRDLVAGSGLVLDSRGTVALRGVPEPRELFAVAAG